MDFVCLSNAKLSVQGLLAQRSGVLIGGRGVVGDTNRPQLGVGKPARTGKIFTGCICLPINHWLLTMVRIFFIRFFSPELIFHSLFKNLSISPSALSSKIILLIRGITLIRLRIKIQEFLFTDAKNVV